MPPFPANLESLGDFVRLGGILFGLLIIYILTKITWNIFFHPLSRYPGPKLHAATSLINTYLLIRGKRVYEISKLHNKYGPVVRIAPNQLSFVDEEAWKGIYSAHKTGQLQKVLPDDPLNHNSLFSNPSDKAHNFLRKKISPAFSEKNIRDREGILKRYIDLLVTRVKESSGKPTDLLFWYECTTLDITGHLAFGEPFDCLKNSTMHPLMVAALEIFKAITIVVDLSQYPLMPWLMAILRKVTDNPFVEGVIGRTIEARIRKRQNEDALGSFENEDLPPHISYLMKGKGTEKELPPPVLQQVAADLLVAGSDTVATVLSAATYLLLTHPTKLAALHTELRTLITHPSQLTLTTLPPLPYLSAIISETMRLFPAAPETFPRLTNPGGNTICSNHIPAGTIVGVFHWAAGHNAASWKDVEEFVPERWLGEERYKGDMRGVVGFFNAGPRNCVGQNLANAELRLILANIFWEFDLELMPESKDWGEMKSWGLVYDKRHLMVKVIS